MNILVKKVGSGEEALLIDSPANEYLDAWSKDGKYITYVKQRESNSDFCSFPLSGGKKPFVVVQSFPSGGNSDFSYNTKWLAYQSDESGTNQVYAISFPAADQKRQISNNGGVQPKWSRSGKELYYLALDGKLMVANLTTNAGINSGIPRELFDTGLIVNQAAGEGAQYAVTPDGQRFLLLKPLAEATSAAITVVLNWTSLLKK